MESKVMIMNIISSIKNITNLLLDASIDSKDYDIYLESLNKYIKLYHKVLNSFKNNS